MTEVKIIEKIDRQCESLRAKISKLSGNYLTNTWKRQNEQKHRDTQKEQLRQQLELYEHLKNEAAARKLSAFENALLTGTFYNNIRVLANSSVRHVVFPERDGAFRGKLIKAGICDIQDLKDALTLYTEMLKIAVTPTDLNTIRLRNLIFKARLLQKGDIQFTPDAIVERMIALADIDSNSKVLEPEAGIASIADKVREITTDVDCVEISPDFREILKLKGHNLVAQDFFEYEQQPIYDAVIMNPPFSDEIDHVKHAFGFLKPNGTLVAVCSTRFNYLKNKGYPEFHEWMMENDLYYEDAGNEFEMTGTASVVLVLKKVDEAQVA